MKFIHLSDLHIGKIVNGFSMEEDQKHILGQILGITDAEKPDAVLIAGDIYDKDVPSREAMRVFQDFLVALSGRGLQIFIVSGNHDSATRLAYMNGLLHSNIHIAGEFDGTEPPVTLSDEYGNVNIFMLPFIKPTNVRVKYGLTSEDIEDYTAAVAYVTKQMAPDESERNILVAHQFVTDSQRSDSEQTAVGGLDNVDASAFEAFDYVALGHLHRPQNCGSEKIRYCGTPLKYSFSEAKDEKSVTVITLGQKGGLSLKTVPLTPLHDMAEIKGSYSELASKGFNGDTAYKDDYLHITLTDETPEPDAKRKLDSIYSRIMVLDYESDLKRSADGGFESVDIQDKTAEQVCLDFYRDVIGGELTDEEKEYIFGILEELGGEQK